MNNFTAVYGLVFLVTSLISAILSSKFLSAIPIIVKLLVSSVLRLVAFIALFLAFLVPSNYLAFLLTLVSSALLGCITSVDVAALLDFLKDFPEFCTEAFNSGMGVASVAGSGIMIGSSSQNIKFSVVALGLIPTIIVMLLAYFWMAYLKKCSENYDEEEFKKNQENELLLSEDEPPKKKEKEPEQNPITTKNALSVFLVGIRWYLNIFLGLLLTNLCFQSFIDRATMHVSQEPGFLNKNSFMILMMSSSVGAFIGKQSLLCFEINKIEIGNLLLAVLVVAFGVMTLLGVSNIFGQIGIVCFVGAISWVVLNQATKFILNDENIDKKNKNVAMALKEVMNQGAVLIAYVCAVLIATLLLPY